ncbi:putative transporter [Cyphellophora attinorum]|uniref:Putative transporter n=1 Tax=Cyphellophora attinorum TaxID=1664694 RepID=A0A0N1HTA6_9EURO|nr:putative transporter [Phialophora attinorum]KPI39687.1 putative transporter [Phialophora attinorum]
MAPSTIAEPSTPEVFPEELPPRPPPTASTSPANWTPLQRHLLTAHLSLSSLLSLSCASAPSPLLPRLSILLSNPSPPSPVLTLLTMTIYFLSLGLSPLCFAPLSEHPGIGRRPILLGSLGIFTLANALTAITGSSGKPILGLILTMRFLAGWGAGTSVVLSAPVMRDLYPKEENRGKGLALVGGAVYLGPALGPLFGGVVGERVGWRWVFWIMALFGAALLASGWFLVRESSAAKIEYLKVQREKEEAAAFKVRWRKERLLGVRYFTLRDGKVVMDKGTVPDDLEPPTRLPSGLSTIAPTAGSDHIEKAQIRLGQALLRPIRLFCTRPILTLIALLNGMHFGIYCIVLSTFATLYSERYHQSESSASLHYMAIALGASIAVQVSGRLMDLLHRRLKARYAARQTDKKAQEFRMPLGALATVIVPIGLTWYGWAAERHAHWIVVDIAVVFWTIGTFALAQVWLAYTVDEFGPFAASASAASKFWGYLAGFLFPLFSPLLYERLGYGVGNTVLAVLFLAIAWPVPILLWLYGPRVRALTWGRSLISEEENSRQ